ncbi:MAG TPA: TonB-dependent receptor [Candidatus Binatia bacterium]|nr:TonB-dependent receptor [Candidatus Binatia bacterium]
MRRLLHLALALLALPLFAQSNSGELRLKVSGPDGLPLKSAVEISSDAIQFRRSLSTDDSGQLTLRNLRFGIYRLHVQRESFSSYDGIVDLRSALPTDLLITLNIAALSTAVNVTAEPPLIDPESAGSSTLIDQQQISDRLSSIPGRSLQDLVNSQPGWLYEGNAVLHPRGSEYQTQFVIDGIPLTDNRSPSFGPEIEADDVDSMNIYTAGIPAEYGRKMGGIVELNTLRDSQQGTHGDVALSGGSFDTAAAFARVQNSWGRNTLGASASGSMSAHYLNPVVPQNFTNRGTTGDFSLSFARDLTPKDHLSLSLRHELSRYQIPNELVQQNGGYLPDQSNTVGCPPVPPGQEPGDCIFVPGGQLQSGGNFETMGIATYQHIFSPNVLLDVRGMGRDHATDFNSNPASWPLIAAQHNDFKEFYFNSSIAVHHGRQEWKAGIESDAIFLRENFSYLMPDCATLSDPQCPIALGYLDAGATAFAFAATRPDLEQSAFLQDLIHLGNWTVNAGLRWDHYQLLLNQNAVSPRLAVSRYFPSASVIVHASYDRVFQTPSFENILLSSSPAAEALDTSVQAVQLPVRPSHGNYFELGATKAFLAKIRLDANMFRRDVNNFADDSQILSTGISFPIAFRKAVLYGAEARLQLLEWRGFSGSASYSYIVGNVWNPVTGGLFLGNDAAGVTTSSGHFPDSQDQRNSVRARVRYQIAPRLWMALGCDYNSGLPFQPDLTAQQYAAEYGQVVINHLNFDRNRIRPYFTQNASLGLDLYSREKRSLRLQADVQNLSNQLELIDFGGLFSGNAIGPARSYFLRLVTTF